MLRQFFHRPPVFEKRETRRNVQRDMRRVPCGCIFSKIGGCEQRRCKTLSIQMPQQRFQMLPNAARRRTNHQCDSDFCFGHDFDSEIFRLNRYNNRIESGDTGRSKPHDRFIDCAAKKRRPRRKAENLLFPPRQRITRAMCEALEANGLPTGRYELIDGVIYRTMPKNLPHRIASWRFRQWLNPIYGEAFVQKEDPISLPGEEGSYTAPESDIAVTRQPAEAYVTGNPGPSDVRLLVEISDSTLPFDLKTKSAIPARAGIPEY